LNKPVASRLPIGHKDDIADRRYECGQQQDGGSHSLAISQTIATRARSGQFKSRRGKWGESCLRNTSKQNLMGINRCAPVDGPASRAPMQSGT
jgi:hypothetical protein